MESCECDEYRLQKSRKRRIPSSFSGKRMKSCECDFSRLSVRFSAARWRVLPVAQRVGASVSAALLRALRFSAMCSLRPLWPHLQGFVSARCPRCSASRLVPTSACAASVACQRSLAQRLCPAAAAAPSLVPLPALRPRRACPAPLAPPPRPRAPPRSSPRCAPAPRACLTDALRIRPDQQ